MCSSCVFHSRGNKLNMLQVAIDHHSKIYASLTRGQLRRPTQNAPTSCQQPPRQSKTCLQVVRNLAANFLAACCAFWQRMTPLTRWTYTLSCPMGDASRASLPNPSSEASSGASSRTFPLDSSLGSSEVRPTIESAWAGGRHAHTCLEEALAITKNSPWSCFFVWVQGS